ncbi:MAG: DNA repair protein RecO [bacterium]|nr:DNA repair protein RecO [bacterium]
MYHIYQTNGWILGSINVGEANRFLDIFTSELGLVRGMAQGVRKINSKLRYGLQDYSFGKISLVKGKQFWRVVGAEKVDDFNSIYADKNKYRLMCRIFSLLKRLIKGEEKDADIFEEVSCAVKFMAEHELSKEALSSLEIILVFRILHKLGYVGRDGELNHLTDFSDWDTSQLSLDNTKRSLLLKQINNSLAHSHL